MVLPRLLKPDDENLNHQLTITVDSVVLYLGIVKNLNIGLVVRVVKKFHGECVNITKETEPNIFFGFACIV